MVETENPSGESALVIHVPEAEVLVGSYRIKYDHAASLGVPAHITLLWPFIPPPLISNKDLQTLTDLFSQQSAFELALTEIQRFPDVLYLAPTPKTKIVDLIQNIARMFPNYPPYGGQFKEVIPHLTIAQSGDSELLDKLTEEIKPEAAKALPIKKQISEISLLEQTNGFWHKTKTFPMQLIP